MEWLWLLVLAGLFFLFARFTIVQEGTAKAVMRLGEFCWIIFRWQGHWMDEEWTILRKEEKSEFQPAKKTGWGPPWRLFGGWYLYGFWPIHTIHKYKHRWTDIKEQDGKLILKFNEEWFSHVLLRPAVYAIKLTDLETKPPERIPVTIVILVTIKISNPYRFLFVAPPTPFEDVLARMGAEMRPILTNQTLDHILLLRGSQLWTEERAKGTLLGEVKIISETMGKWGLELADRGVEIRLIDLPPEYQKAAADKKAQELRAAGRAEEIRGTVVSAVARSSNRKETDVQAEFAQDPAAFYARHQRTIDDVMTKLSMEAQAYLKGEFPQATTLEGLIALLGRLPRGSRGKIFRSDAESEIKPEPFGEGRAAEVFKHPPKQ